MKQIYFLASLLILVLSCRKQTNESPEAVLKQRLADSLAPEDYNWLRFDKVSGYAAGEDLVYIQIPMGGKRAGEFVLLQVRQGKLQQGRIVQLVGQRSVREGRATWNGNIVIHSLGRRLLLQSPVKEGHITAFQRERGGRLADIVPVYPSGEYLPVVVVTAYRSDSGISYADWMWLESFFRDSGTSSGNNYGGWYGSMDGSTGGSYDGGGSGGGSYYSGNPAPVIYVDYETQDQRGGIDLQQYVNCFNAIPDAGATCSIEIFADVPVDSEPDLLFDYAAGSPGHTFLQIKKSNGPQGVLQNIGFYPNSRLKALLTDAPIASKFVDNSQHEFNASFKMSLTPAQLNSVLTELLYLKNMSYDIDDYNCTDWALAVFNKVRSNRIEIPLFSVPGVPGTGVSTPQGLWSQLNEMKRANHPESSNIYVSNYKNFVANSTGPCN